MARKPPTSGGKPPSSPGADGRSTGSDYAVGYGRPPEHTRFKPGRSGNPKGRPKRHCNLRTIVEDILNEQIRIREGERTRDMPRLEALVRTILNRALKGDPRAVNALLALIRTTDLAGEEPEVAEAEAWTQDDQALLADYLRRHGPGALGGPLRRDEPTGDGGDAS
jgi:Family of unknown function (DUF5681)